MECSANGSGWTPGRAPTTAVGPYRGQTARENQLIHHSLMLLLSGGAVASGHVEDFTGNLSLEVVNGNRNLTSWCAAKCVAHTRQLRPAVPPPADRALTIPNQHPRHRAQC